MEPPKQLPTTLEQIERFKALLLNKQLSKEHPAFQATMNFLRSGLRFNEEDKREFLHQVTTTFQLNEQDLALALAGIKEGTWSDPRYKTSLEQEVAEQKLLEALPSGWFRDYVNYNSHTEVPLAYHVFSALVLVGAALGRRAWFEMGPFRIYPPQGVIIIGPSGAKKTTATDIAVAVLGSVNLCPVYAEKLTPEALVEGMSVAGSQGLIYAPEASVLMGKQKYNEGLVPLVTRLMDCPAYLTTATISRGVTELKEVAASILACSTADWFIKNTPEDLFGGGFIARVILVYQTRSSKEIAIPKVTSFSPIVEFGKFLLKLKNEIKGVLEFTTPAEKLYVEWYGKNKRVVEHPPYEAAGPYYQRKPIHLLRTAGNLHVASCQTRKVCEECLQRALTILAWNEAHLPALYEELFRSPHGEDQKFVLEQIAAVGGAISQVSLMRRVQYKMSSAQLRSVMGSLKEAKQVEELSNSLFHIWRLV